MMHCFVENVYGEEIAIHAVLCRHNYAVLYVALIMQSYIANNYAVLYIAIIMQSYVLP